MFPARGQPTEPPRCLALTTVMQFADSPHILAAIRVLNRPELVCGETLCLNSPALVASGWLWTQVPSEWFDRYGTWLENYRLPTTATAREALAVTIGAGGRRLLQAADATALLRWGY